jgi:hypothetical protein
MLGTVGTGMSPVSGLAIQSDLGGTPAIGLSADGTMLVRFNTATPGTSVSITIPAAGMPGGPAMGEVLVAIDYRPQTGQLYGLGVNETANTATLYLIDPQPGTGPVLTIVNTRAPGVAGAIAFVNATGGGAVTLPAGGYGMDFSPVDLIRITTASGLNFRINRGGQPVDTDLNATNGINPDPMINGLPMGSTGVSATAYTNSFGIPLLAAVTSQYTLDAASNMLFIQDPPQGAEMFIDLNNGKQTKGKVVTLNGAPLDFTDVNGFDISGARVTTSGAVATGVGTAVLTVSGVSILYKIDLSTGEATVLGPAPTALNGLAIGDTPAGVIAFSGATFRAAEGGTLTLTFTRTGGTNGPVTGTVTVTGGTATAGIDLDTDPFETFTVTFADGATTATVSIPIESDTTRQGAETIEFSLSMPTNGAVLGAQTMATATITDAARAFGTIISSPNSPNVTVLNPNGTLLGTFTPFAGAAGVRTALGDITGDGVDDLIMSATNSPTVAIFNGATGALIASGQAFDSSFGSASVAVGDFTGDGTGDLLVGSSFGGLVRVFDGATGAMIANAQPFAGYAGGFNVAAGDLDGDGFDEIVLGTTTVSGRVFIASPTKGVLVDAVGVGGTGVAVATGDLDGDGLDDLILGALSGAPTVRVVYATGTSNTFTVQGAQAPLSVAAVDVDGDGLADVVIGSGSGGSVFAFAGDDLAFLGTNSFGFDRTFVA